MSKAKIIDKKSTESILAEKRILTELHHPFIVNMIYSFQDLDYLYLVMEILQGGNLRYHLSLKKRFNENQIKFLIGCIMIGLKYIHSQNILHRDIKPENLVFDKNGYLRITDFGIAKHYVVNNKKDTSGTIGYLAPEVLCNVNHNFSIDYYAVGIITYELMFGHRPYIGKNKHEVKQLILTRQAKVEYEDIPFGFSNSISDFINGLIQRKPKNRLGKNNINEVINHSWFADFDWDNCLNKKLIAPYKPKYGDNFDKNYCLQNNKIGTETMDRYEKIMSKENIHLIFKEFDCEKIPEELKGYNNKNKNDNNLFVNNNISSNMSTTSISRNNKIENKQDNRIIYYNDMNNDIINRNIIKKKIINNDIRNSLNLNNDIGLLHKTNYELNYNKYINNININDLNYQEKTLRNKYLNKTNKSNFNGDNFNISSILKYFPKNNNNYNNISQNEIYSKNKKKIKRNISAKYVNRNSNKEKLLFNNNSTLEIKNKTKKKEINLLRDKKNKLRNHSTKVTREQKEVNKFYDMKLNNKNNKYNTKREYMNKGGKINSETLYYQKINNNISASFISSNIYSKKKKNKKKLTTSNSMNNLFENNFINKKPMNNKLAKNKSKQNIIDSNNKSNLDKNFPYLNISMNKKNEIENDDIFYRFDEHKTKNGLNYDYLMERIKKRKKKNGGNIDL